MTRSSNLALRLRTDDNKVVGGDGKADDKNSSKKPKNAKCRIQTYIEATGEPTFLTPNAKEVFNQLK